ncbi:MAG: hypothetical protein CMJ81_21585 [Planctomycetaceae bacterium]|jgi:hypothetical protein|nr:hypothetical protein [Planctomycetaceae bacterium]MBP60013.1 hypothetical protein [Planctomycetaceae bacterium]
MPGSRAFAENLQTRSDEATSLQKKPLVLDVALGDRGTLLGYVVDGKGVRQGSKQLIVRRNGEELAVAVTDAEGRFLVSGLSGGVVELEVSGRATACRVWYPGTAPPVARRAILLVTDDAVKLGQREFGTLLHSDPALLGLFLVAAILVPVIITSATSSSSPPAS